MKRLMIFVILFLGLLVGCSTNGEVISPQRAKQMLDTREDVVLVDVRTAEEYAESRIPGSILVPLGSLETLAATKMADKNTTYIIYCRSGNRSADAIEILIDMGYTDLYDLGGIIDWPYEKVSG